ncbi:M48 family metallopeptidase [Paracoccus sp. S1E-3]|uniref:M48 family metallopeptidase n=1 Tax=Paracoccus sp. S1E-3 TaxID=2756130 RepID=UPI0015EFAC31|nr:M48 family metallopeptidase [Paracoccus sp. S1E-3]MBA4492009.1 M48 family metallopeptidase [Paracoccus sp. S1E-3]
MCSNPTTPQNNFTRFRHRWEMPMIWLSAAITFGALLGALAIFMADTGTELNDALGEDTATTLRDWSSSLMLLLIAPIAIYIFRFYMAAKEKAGAIRVGPKQFPELWAMYQDLGRRLDMPDLPRLYVTNGNGVVNAFALECNRRNRYIVINAEIAMMLPTAPDVVEFVLGHEMAHHKLRHVSLWRNFITIIPNILVLPGQATTRAQEYSADRVALAICPDHANAVRLLSVGPWMANGVDPEAWLEQAEDEHREWMVRAANAMSSHAVGIKRYKALRDIEREGFKAQGEMF